MMKNNKDIKLVYHWMIITIFVWKETCCNELAKEKAMLHCVVIAKNDKSPCSTNSIVRCTRKKNGSCEQFILRQKIWISCDSDCLIKNLRLNRKGQGCNRRGHNRRGCNKGGCGGRGRNGSRSGGRGSRRRNSSIKTLLHDIRKPIECRIETVRYNNGV